MLKDWVNVATTDLSTIVDWWSTHPQANIAGLAGPDLLVLDIDDRNGGWDSFQALLDENGCEEPFTPTSMSGGGGAHFIFANTLGAAITTRNGVLPGIDILAGGHSFILPGSTHASGGTYEWASDREFGAVELADPPGWLVELMMPAGSIDKPSSESRGGQILEGHRNSHVFGVVSNLLKAHMTGDTLRRVASSYNQTVCHPPLAETELAQIVLSAESRQPSRPDEEPLTILSRKGLARSAGAEVPHRRDAAGAVTEHDLGRLQCR